MNKEKNTEKEIFSCNTGFVIPSEFFCRQQSIKSHDFLPAIHALADKCDGMITGPGWYAIKLQLVKLHE